MLDIDPRMDQKLRSLYEQIEATSPPSHLAQFDPERSGPRRRGFNFVVATAALAVVAVAVVGFAVELRAHLSPPAAAHRPVQATPTPAPTPTFWIDAPPVVPGNPVANPSFDVPRVGAVSTVTSLKGWKVVGDVELVPVGTIGQPFYGRQYLVLESSPVAGGVSQRVKTVPGTNYQLIFTTGLNPACTGSGMLDVFWNGRQVLGMDAAPGTPPTLAPGDQGWSTDAFASALATGTTSTIGFVGAGACGASLNDVILQPAPVPVG